MFLNFGLNENGDFVSIDKVESGKTDLVCPFCNDSLQAKKGKVKEHHFAHLNETCRDSKEAVEKTNVPLFDTFNILTKPEQKYIDRFTRYGLKGMFDFEGRKAAEKSLIQLGLLDETIDYSHSKYSQFIEELSHEMPGLVQDNEPSDELKKLFKIIKKHSNTTLIDKSRTALKLNNDYRLNDYNNITDVEKFADVQSFWIEKQRLRLSLQDPELLPLYEKRVEQLNQQSLYLLRCNVVDGESFYKIGMTTRDIEERVDEVKRDLKKHIDLESIDVVNCWNGLGRIERLLHKFYDKKRIKISSYREYFNFKSYDLDNLLRIEEAS